MSKSFSSTFFAGLLVAMVLGGNSGCKRVGESILKSVVPGASLRTVADSSPDQLREMIQQTNKNCPVQMDAFTTLQRIEVLDETNIEYQYLVNQKGSAFVGELDESVLRALVIKEMNGNPMAVAVAEHGLRIHHIYRDESGRSLLQYVIDRESLNGESQVTTASVKKNAAPNINDVFFESIEPTDLAGETQVSLSGAEVDPRADAERLPKDISSVKDEIPKPWRVQKNPFVES